MKRNSKQTTPQKPIRDLSQKSFSLDNRDYILIVLILFFSVLLFGKVVHFEFLNFDDPDYVMLNPMIRDLSFSNFIKIFTTPVIGMYNPITFLVYAIEYELFGLNPKYFHLFNLIFHLFASVVLYVFSKRITGRYESALIITLLFAVHPMHVGVVAWVSQTKTSLMFIFYLLALISYLKTENSDKKILNTALTFLFFILALLSKPDAVTLPLVLMLIDYYRKEQISFSILTSKIPYLTLSLFFGMLTLYTHSKAEDVIFNVSKEYSLFNSILVGNYGLVFYIHKFFYPIDLVAIDPYPEANPYLPLRYYVSLPIIPIWIFLIYKVKSFRKEMIFGSLFFLITIIILVKFVPTGFFKSANRYSYLSYVGLSFIVAQFMTYVIDNRFGYKPLLKKYFTAFLVVGFVFLSYRVTIRVNTWKDNMSLYNDVLKKRPNVPIAYKNRGNVKLEKRDYAGALQDFEKSYQLDTTDKQVLNNIAAVYFATGNYEEAIRRFSYVIEKLPGNGIAYYNRGIAKFRINDKEGGLTDLRKAASLKLPQAIDMLKKNDPTYSQMHIGNATTMKD